jgi:hypothetical protein
VEGVAQVTKNFSIYQVVEIEEASDLNKSLRSQALLDEQEDIQK